MQQAGSFPQAFFGGHNGAAQQYALVPLNGGPAVMNGPHQSAFPPIGPSPGLGLTPGMASPHMGAAAFLPGINGFRSALLPCMPAFAKTENFPPITKNLTQKA